MVQAAIRAGEPQAGQSSIPYNLAYLRAKRLVDLVLVSAALVPLSVIMAIAALAIRLDSPGPVIFRQRRVGRDGVEFDMLKFRSMVHNCAETSHHDAYARFMQGAALNADDSTMPYKIGHDPRITRVGRFLRKTSLDELPQLWNVLKGEMSIVGPRPPIPYEVEMYSPFDRLRLAGPPGLTGPWQVYGRGRVPFYVMVDQDISYLRSQSLLYDLKLMLLTVPVILFGRGGA